MTDVWLRALIKNDDDWNFEKLSLSILLPTHSTENETYLYLDDGNRRVESGETSRHGNIAHVYLSELHFHHLVRSKTVEKIENCQRIYWRMRRLLITKSND